MSESAAAATAAATRSGCSAAPSSYPSEYEIAAAPASRLSSSIGTSTWVGVICELPPPWIRGSLAARPMTAIRPPPASGRTPSFLSRTMPSAAIRLARAWCAAASNEPPLGDADARAMTRRTRSAASSTTFSSRAPAWTASMTERTRRGRGPGISRSVPAATALGRSWTAAQSETTNPSNPHSDRSTSVSSW